MNESVKHDVGKDPWELLPMRPVQLVVQVLGFGARKYAPHAWRGVPNGRDRYFAAAMRHLVAWRSGEPLDQGGWGLAALLDLFDRRYEDRARTILTVNVTIDAFRLRYGQDGGRFLDRLREAGKWFNVAGTSRRKPEAP